MDRSHEIGNFFVGSIGGLAIYNKAVSNEEMYQLGYL